MTLAYFSLARTETRGHTTSPLRYPGNVVCMVAGHVTSYAGHCCGGRGEWTSRDTIRTLAGSE